MAMQVAMLLDAADKRGQAFEAVDKSLLTQEIERPVDRGRGGRAALGAQAFEQVVGTSGTVGFQDQAEHMAAQPGQAGAALVAQRLGPVEQGCGAG